MALLSPLATEIVIPVCAVIGIVFALVTLLRNSDNGRIVMRDHMKEAVFQGVKHYCSTGCPYLVVFTVALVSLSFLVLGSVENFSTQSRPCKSDPSTCKPALATAFFTAVSFILGALISVLSGFLGTGIAIFKNASIALEDRNVVGANPIAALGSGAVMGFLPAGLGLLLLHIEIYLFNLYYGNDWEGLFEAIIGYGLGGSSVALFGRVCGGIYAKVADVCLLLVIQKQPPCTADQRDRAVITYYVGDIVGDIAGVASDFFGSFAEISCAALVVTSVSSFGIKHDFTAVCYPLLISSMGILVGVLICGITILITQLAWERALLIISTILMTAGILVVGFIALPPLLTVYKIEEPEVATKKVVKYWELSLCVALGLWTWLISKFFHGYEAGRPNDIFSALVNFVAENVNVGLGSVNMPLPVIFILSVIFHYAATYGIAVAALGRLIPISTQLAKDAYDRISDHARRINQMATGRGHDADDNPAPDIKEKLASESTALVTLVLIGAFGSRLAILPTADVLTPNAIVGLMLGFWLPSLFSAMTMKRVGSAGFEMARQVLRQNAVGQRPDYDACFNIATDASFKSMIGLGALVMFLPFIVGTLFGVATLSGLLTGALGFVCQKETSASNAGGAWIQAEEDITDGALEYGRTLRRTLPFNAVDQSLLKAAQYGNIAGDPRKDTLGPLLNILIQLMAVESLVLAPWFARHGNLLSKII